MRTTPARLGILGLILWVAGACGRPIDPSVTVVDLGLDQAGQTVQVRVGDEVRITLQDQFPVPGSSLVWRVTSSAPRVLSLASESRPSPAPGLGNRDYVAVFATEEAGQATLDAHGTTECEAMMKSACPDRDFTITVVVSG